MYRISPFTPVPCDTVVLCGISSNFSLLSPFTRQVTHALLTRPPLALNRSPPLARLACVKHAASVHPEPGSNSRLKFVCSSFLYLAFCFFHHSCEFTLLCIIIKVVSNCFRSYYRLLFNCLVFKVQCCFVDSLVSLSYLLTFVNTFFYFLLKLFCFRSFLTATCLYYHFVLDLSTTFFIYF